MSDNPATVSMDEIKALCKRRGFIYPASEIYGGLNGFWDYGPLGGGAQEQPQGRLVAEHGAVPACGP